MLGVSGNDVSRPGSMDDLAPLQSHQSFKVRCQQFIERIRAIISRILRSISSAACRMVHAPSSLMRNRTDFAHDDGADACANSVPIDQVVCGTILHTASKDRNEPLADIERLKNHGADPSLPDFWGNTPLLWAVADANNSTAREILKQFGNGPYIDAQDKQYQNTALHLAVGKGYKEKSRDGRVLKCTNFVLVLALLEHGANPNIQNKDGNTSLHLACLRRDFEMVSALLGAGARTDIKNKDGKTPEQLLEVDISTANEVIYHTVMWPGATREGQFEPIRDSLNGIALVTKLFHM